MLIRYIGNGFLLGALFIFFLVGINYCHATDDCGCVDKDPEAIIFVADIMFFVGVGFVFAGICLNILFMFCKIFEKSKKDINTKYRNIIGRIEYRKFLNKK